MNKEHIFGINFHKQGRHYEFLEASFGLYDTSSFV